MKKMITCLLITTYVFSILGANALGAEEKHQHLNKIQIKVKKTHQSRQSEKNKIKKVKNVKQTNDH